jgi:hypothetical protein
MNTPNFPQDYFHFGGGVKISDEEINNRVKNCIEKLEENKHWGSTAISSGDTRVEVIRVAEEEDPDYYEYQVVVSKDYWTKTVRR